VLSVSDPPRERAVSVKQAFHLDHLGASLRSHLHKIESYKLLLQILRCRLEVVRFKRNVANSPVVGGEFKPFFFENHDPLIEGEQCRSCSEQSLFVATQTEATITKVYAICKSCGKEDRVGTLDNGEGNHDQKAADMVVRRAAL
jgi:hypothetical protein